MFGMLDYRAHKLYWLLFFIPSKILFLIAIFGLPLINYLIGFQLAETRFFQILISLISLFVIEMIWLLLIFNVTDKLFQFIFSLLVDVIPHDGRTKEEAQLVVWNGEKAVRALALNKGIDTWTDELILEMPKNDWVINMFYRDDVIRRLELIREEFNNRSSDDSPFTETEMAQILKDNSLKLGWFEKLVTDLRASIYSYTTLLLLFYYNPMAS
jgi:hypothetical protein